MMKPKEKLVDLIECPDMILDDIRQRHDDYRVVIRKRFRDPGDCAGKGPNGADRLLHVGCALEWNCEKGKTKNSRGRAARCWAPCNWAGSLADLSSIR